MHKKLLCTTVPVFEKMFNGGFKEASEQRAELPEDDARTFGFFLEWLYTDRVQEFGKKAPQLGVCTHDHVKLYCFADKYCHSELMSFAMEELLTYLSITDKCPSTESIEYTYKHTAQGSPLRKLMARTLCAMLAYAEEIYPSEVLCDLLHSSKDLTMDYLELTRNAK